MSILEVNNVSKFFGGVKANVDISMSVKKGSIIDPSGNIKDNLFVAHQLPLLNNMPKGTKTMEDYINTLTVNAKSGEVFNAKFNQMLSGAIYGKAHDAKIMKQYDNWSSKKVALDVYEYSRADLVDRFSEVSVELYNPEDVYRASQEAKSFINNEGNKDGTISTEVTNASTASIGIEAGGVPFNDMNKHVFFV